MKIALINAAELEMSPYLRTYMEYYETLSVSVDIIEWRRDLAPNPKQHPHIVSFNYPASISKKPIQKLMDYWRFAQFAKSIIKQNKYDKLIIFEYQCALFLQGFIKRNYSNRYIIDIRDYSGRFSFFRPFVKSVDEHSYARVLSSPGYKEWAAPVKREAICHNTTFDRLEETKDIEQSPFNNPLVILTNGNLRTFEIDKSVVDAFNGTNVRFRFAGKGKESDLYEELSRQRDNVEYTGFYKRDDEITIAKSASFINIFLGDDVCYNTAMGNRFYLSLVSGVPMIVNAQNVQSKYASKYHLGVVAETAQEIPLKLEEYIKTFNINDYNKGRKQVVEQIMNDMKGFYNLLDEFLG